MSSALANRGLTVDVDLVPRRATFAEIAPYLDASWRAYLHMEDSSSGSLLTYKLPESAYWSPEQDAIAPDHAWSPEDVRAHLDQDGYAFAVLNPGNAGTISGLNHPDLAAELARATNEWTVSEWLAADERLLGSIVVAPHNPHVAADEIRRAAAHPRMVQVTVAYPKHFVGSRYLAPIHAAADECRLPLNLQANAAFTGVNLGYAAGGYPGSMLEFRIADTYGAQPHVASMIAEGVFDRFPNLRLVINGFGVAWLPSLAWSMDQQHARDPRGATLEGRPSDYLRRFVRIGTQGLELPEAAEQLTDLLALVGGHDLLLLSSDGDGPRYVDTLPDEIAHRVRYENASALYRLDREGSLEIAAARDLDDGA